MPEPTQRRLAAIVAADVVGYSRMMRVDEVGTLEALRRRRSDVIDPRITERGGRIVKTMGDGLLLEFPSVVAAVEFAVATQRALVEYNAAAGNAAIRFRIGIHIGDVIIEGDDIFGDGVNVAARVEPLAGSDGVAVTDDAYRLVRDRVDVQWWDGGAHLVKNIERPIRVWHWGSGPAPESRPSLPPQDAPQEALDPSIAVLPFDNMSGDPEQDLFAMGMTEDLITDLSKLSGMFVLSRSTTAGFSGQTIDVRDVAVRLGVRYVLEGSVRKAGNRVRINVKLTDADGQGHMWAERYDGSIDDVFELQDEVGAKVVSALSVRLHGDEEERLHTVHTRNLAAYELYVQAKTTPYPPVPAKLEAARAIFERVIEMDPGFAGGHAGLASLLGLEGVLGHHDLSEVAPRATELAERAIAVDDNFGWGYTAMSLALVMRGRHDEANAAAEQAILRQPNDADAHAYRGFLLALSGDPGAAVDPILQAIRLNPGFIDGPYLNLLTLARFIGGDFAGAIEAFEENRGRKGPVGPPALAWGSGAYQGLGQEDRARRLASEAQARLPVFHLTSWNLLRLIRRDDQRQRVRDLMRTAGVPE